MSVVGCKRLHFPPFQASTGLALTAFLLWMLWFAVSCSKTSHRTEREQADSYVGTWELAEPLKQAHQGGISFLMIGRESTAEENFVVVAGQRREIFRMQEGRLIHDTVTILYDDARDTLQHSALGELTRKGRNGP